MITHDQVQQYVNKIVEAYEGEDFFFTGVSNMYKIIHTLANGQTVVHCFVNKENGDIYKADTFYKAAKGKRGNILDENPPLTLKDYYYH